jgi:hypothetical protein
MKKLRQELVALMNNLEEQGVTCAQCEKANCCTFERNSMMVTPLETVELYYFLKKNNKWNNEMIDTLKQTVAHYRLDKEMPSDGKRLFARRSYSCPFLSQGPLACGVDPMSKPYGCLAFNATTRGAVDDANCNSDQSVLEELNNKYQSQLKELNQSIIEKFKLEQHKKSIPVALLDIDDLKLDINEIEEFIISYEKNY